MPRRVVDSESDDDVPLSTRAAEQQPKTSKGKPQGARAPEKDENGNEWHFTGHKWLGVLVARSFGRTVAVGQITKWLPPDGEDGALFKAVHLDGDEEDLEDHEVVEAIQKYRAARKAKAAAATPPRPVKAGSAKSAFAKAAARAAAASAADEDEDEDDEDDEDDGTDEDDTPRRGGRGGKRKKIRRVKQDDEVKEETRAALEAEAERRRQVGGGIDDEEDEEEEDEEGLVLNVAETRGSEASAVRLQPALGAQLKPHQLSGARFLFDNVCVSCASLRAGREGMGALLAHSMGLGKTLTAISLIDALLTSAPLREAARAGGVAGFRTVLVVAPATVLQNWCDEAEKWSERAKMSYFYYHVKAEQPLKKRIATLREWARDGGVAVIGYEALLALVKGKEV